MTNYHYGLTDKAHAKHLALTICGTLGGSADAAVALLLETAAAETQLGTYADPTPNGAGRGCCQIDPIGLVDIQANSTEHFPRVLGSFGYDLSAVTIDDVQDDPKLAFILCRLHYMRVPEPIPATRTARAEYWKRHYNTAAGKGTVEHYLASAARLL